jgi:hypothetical protein
MDAIRAELAAERRVLGDLFFRLSHDLATGSYSSLQVAWCELEHRLLSRMDVEDQFILPVLEADHSADVRCVRAEHQRIRRLVEQLDASIELRTVQQSAIRGLFELLADQAEREDRRLYHFVWERASSELQHRVAALLRAALRSAHEAALRTSASRLASHDRA